MNVFENNLSVWLQPLHTQSGFVPWIAECGVSTMIQSSITCTQSYSTLQCINGLQIGVLIPSGLLERIPVNSQQHE